MAIRHRSRHLHATLLGETRTGLTAAGWVNTPVNFGVTAVTFLDHEPMSRGTQVLDSTVAVSIGESPTDQDAELGAGLRSAWYPVFVDVYMQAESHVIAICDDVRALFDGRVIPLVDKVTGAVEPGWTIDVEEVVGPREASAFVGAQQFKMHWREMNLGCRLYYPA